MKEMDNYYNDEQKNRFISTLNLAEFPPYYWNRLFRSFKPYEEKYGKDLYDFRKDEIIESYKDMQYSSFETLIVANVNFKRYVDWAIENLLNEDGENHFDDFTTEELFKCVNKLQLTVSIITREQLDKGVSSLDNPQDAFLVYGIFEGIRGKEFMDLVTVKMSDIDMDNKTIWLPDSEKTIPISDSLIQWAMRANSQDVYYRSDGKNYKLYGNNIIKLSGRYATLNADTGNKQSASTYRAVLRALDTMGYGKMVSCNSLYTSGIIDTINKVGTDNGVDAEHVLYTPELYKIVKQKYNIPESTRRRFLLKFDKFLVK